MRIVECPECHKPMAEHWSKGRSVGFICEEHGVFKVISIKRCCPWCGGMHSADGGLWKRHQLRLKEATDSGYWNPGDGYPALEKMKKPQGARRYGKCPNCSDYGWLFDYCRDGRPICEGCIDEARDSAADADAAMDAVNDDACENEDLGHENYDFGDDMEAFC